MNIKHFIGLLVFIALTQTSVCGQSAEEIVRKSDQKVRGKKTSYTEMTMTVVRPKWQREMKMKSWSLGTDYSMILVLAPAKEAGITFLKREKEVWNWLPNIERTIKMPPSMMMQSWMGTDLTNDNLVKESSIVYDYTPRLLGDTVVMDRDCWKLSLKAKPDAPVVWDEVVMCIDKTDYLQLLTKSYDEDGYLINIMKVTEIRAIRGVLLATEVQMIPVDKMGNMTVMKIDDVIFDQDIDPNFFSIQNMKKMK